MADDSPTQDTRDTSGPETLIGWFILALMVDDRRRMRVYRELLGATGWHDASSVIVLASEELIHLRWPAGADDADVDDAIRRAVAISPDRGGIDIDVVKAIVTWALDPNVGGPNVDPRSHATHRLFVLWAFGRQLGMGSQRIIDLIVHAEVAATTRGYAPTKISSLAGDE